MSSPYLSSAEAQANGFPHHQYWTVAGGPGTQQSIGQTETYPSSAAHNTGSTAADIHDPTTLAGQDQGLSGLPPSEFTAREIGRIIAQHIETSEARAENERISLNESISLLCNMHQTSCESHSDLTQKMETTGEELGQLSKRLIGSMELAEGKLEQLCPRPADTVTEEVRGLQLHIERLQDTMDKVTFQQGCMAKELDKLGNVITHMAEAMFDVVFLGRPAATRKESFQQQCLEDDPNDDE
ncbi:hypothetical protein LTR33_000003 [Friedmanniomyces endolithicus]|nr:hypothetical protein LTR87_017994 [Friedmanniomyces endolithicus]KAK1089527.1 hypothetical protein LTR33_000003 [Friedmanniomyces endolithicus]